MTDENTLYVGTSYYFDGDRFMSPQLACIYPNINQVILYMTRVRGYQILDLRDPDPETMSLVVSHAEQEGKIAVTGEITKMTFYSEQQKEDWLNLDHNRLFWMVDHEGSVDSRISGLKQKKAREVMLPEIVEEIIQSEEQHFMGELAVAAHSLKELAIYFSGHHQFRGYTRQTVEMVEILEGIVNGKTDIYDSICSRHPILFCGEPEYRQMLRSYLDYQELRQGYDAAMGLDYT